MDENYWDPEVDQAWNDLAPLLPIYDIHAPNPVNNRHLRDIVNIDSDDTVSSQSEDHQMSDHSASAAQPPMDVPQSDQKSNDITDSTDNQSNPTNNNRSNKTNNSNTNTVNGSGNFANAYGIITKEDPSTIPPCRPILNKRPGPKSLTGINPSVIYDITVPLIRIDADNYAHVNEPGLHITPRDGPYHPQPLPGPSTTQPSNQVPSTSQTPAHNVRVVQSISKSFLKSSTTDVKIKHDLPAGLINCLPYDIETEYTRSAKKALNFDPNASIGYAFATKISELRNYQAGEHTREKKSKPHIEITPCPTALVEYTELPELSPPVKRVYLQNATHYFSFAVNRAQVILKCTNRYENKTLYKDLAKYFSNVNVLGLKDHSYITLNPSLNKLGPGLAATQFILLYPGTAAAMIEGLSMGENNYPLPPTIKEIINLTPYSPIDVRALRIRFNKTYLKWKGNDGKGKHTEDQIYDTIANMLPHLLSFLQLKRDPKDATNYLIHMAFVNSFYQLTEDSDVINRTIASWPLNKPRDVKIHCTTEILQHQDLDIFPYDIPDRQIFTKENPLNITSVDTSPELKTNQWIALLNQSILPRSWSLGPKYLENHPAKALFDNKESNPLDVLVCI